MAKIFPFKAVRPTRDKVSLVTSRSYEEYSAAELASQLDFNPLSFLHILNPAYVHQQTVTFQKRFKLMHQKYQEFKNDHILAADKKPSVYIHKITTSKQTFTGIILAASIEDYKTDVIKRHEDTLEYRVALFKDYIKIAGFNTEPVLLTYPDNDQLEKWILVQSEHEPDFEFSTTAQDTHYLWKIDDENAIANLQQLFADIGNLYIADGHHRSKSAEMLFDENDPLIGDSKNHFMSFAIADSNVRIYEYNRLIKDLNGLEKSVLLEKLETHFDIELKIGNFQPLEKHIFGMYIDNAFYSLALKEHQFDIDSALGRLDAQILYEKVLLPILGIEDLRSDERIEYISGKQSIAEVKSKVDSGEFELAFLLFPATIAEIKAIADAHQMMPPKSTYIEPKFRSGLVVYEL